MSFHKAFAVLLAAAPFSLFLPQLYANNDAWTGLGADANWGTGANWGGAAPGNNDNLIFSGATRQNNTNNTGLTFGWIQFNSGGFVLEGNQLNLNSTAAGIITNTAGTNILALGVNIMPQNKVLSIAAGSELRLAGPVVNTQTANPLATMMGGGTLRLTTTNCAVDRFLTQVAGTLVIDGGVVVTWDGYRLQPPSGTTAVFQLTNNGSIEIASGGNLRLGQTATGGSSRVDMSSGVINIATTSGAGAGDIFVGEAASTTVVFNQNGGLVEFTGNGNNRIAFANASSSANGTYNLNQGTLWTAQIAQVNAGSPGGTFNFNGGTLMPVSNSATFFQGVQAAYVQNGGAIIDTTNLNITIGQSLLGAGTGGLTKLGMGTLTLGGNNTYAGPTIVSNGVLNVTGHSAGGGLVMITPSGLLSGSGTITGAALVQPGGTLSPGSVAAAPVALTLQSNLTLAGNLAIQVNKALSPSNDLIAVGGILTNAGAGTLTMVNSGSAFAVGDSFRIFNQPLLNGAALAIVPSPAPSGAAWTNRLAIDGTLAVISTLPTNTSANLVGLSLSAGTLAPSFNSNTVLYSASVAYTNSSIIVTPTSLVAGSTIQVISSGGTNPASSGLPGAAIALSPGTNVIDVRVTSADASTTKDYVVTVTRIGPNIVLILADDQGFSDWSCYGSEIATPNLDSLAAAGLRFRNFYNAARCSPTRCSILTGLYTQQAAVDPAASLPPLRTDNNITIAELLGANGYHTYMAGKWHLGSGTGQAPEQRGFEEVFTYASGTADHEDCWDPTQYRFASTDGETTNITYAAGTFYQPDAIGDYCLQFLSNQFTRHTNTPFFLYIPFGSAHFLIQAPQAMADTNSLVYSNGWDFIRNQRYTNMLAQGVIDTRYALSPNEGTAPWSSVAAEAIPAWNTLDTNRQADLTRRMAVYASMIQKMDANIGRVVQCLQQNGQLDNTLILALSDNGGNYEGGVYGLTGSTSDAAPLTGISLENMGLSGQPSIYLGGGWAHVSNTPFRWFKHFDHNGGIGTPFIVHWPQGLTRTNQWENQAGHLIDVMATIADVTGSAYPTQFNGHAVLPMQGQSLKALLTNSLAGVPRSLGFEHEGNRAYISGSWKLVTKNFTTYNYNTISNELELYDLSTDPSETTNLAYAQPAVLAQMETNWNNWCVYVGDDSSLLLSSTNNSFLLPALDPAPGSNDLFVDTFDRPDSTNISASAVGMWGSYVPPMGAGAAYYAGFDGSGLPSSMEIADGTLVMANGPGMSESGLMHNFIGQDILDAGGFSIELVVQTIDTDPSDSTNRYVGFGVGLTQAQAATGGDVSDPLPPGAVAFRGEVGGNQGATAFFVELDLNGNIKVWTNGGLLNVVSAGQNTGLLAASFSCTGFTTNDPVVANVFFNGQLVNINPFNTNASGLTFYWNTNNNNYIGLSARATDYAQIDNLAIRKLPMACSLITDYAMSYGLTGTNTAANADPDGDGVNNFAEWAFGGNPSASDAYIASFRGIQVLPGNDFRFEFQRYKDYAAVGLQYHYLISEDLANWTEVTPSLLASSINEDKTDYEVVTLELPAAATAGKAQVFLRIMAEISN